MRLYESYRSKLHHQSNLSKKSSVISSDAMAIAEAVISQMKTSATVFEGYGGYLKEEKDMTYIITNKYQLIKLRRIINQVDNEAFVVVHDVRDVFGESFSWIS